MVSSGQTAYIGSMNHYLAAFLSSLLLLSCSCNVNPPAKVFSRPAALSEIELPEGFQVHYYAQDVVNARSMVLSPSNTLFVSTRKADKVYAFKDTNNDYQADLRYLITDKLKMPNGVAFKDGDLFVAEVDKVWRFPDIEQNLDNVEEPELVYDGYPSDKHHGWKYIAFGPDGKLYIPVGAPCNICESDPIYTTITRIDVNDPDPEIVATGIRNTVGFDWDPQTDELWFTDNGRDWMGDDLPACELNRVKTEGSHYGYPYCHQGDLLDPEFGSGKSCDDYVAPYQNLGPHVAPLGMEFFESSMFPDTYKDCIFIAEHGSWNRSTPIGYRITMVDRSAPDGQRYKDFATGWLSENGNRWGRPVDLEWMQDGSLLVSDDFGDAIYRIFYQAD